MIMPTYMYALIALVCLFITTVDSVRILGIFPAAAKSHFNTNLAIMESLHAAGHQITMISPFPPTRKNVPNFTHIDSHNGGYIFIGQSTLEEFESMTTHGLWNKFAPVDMQYCYDVIKLPEIKEALNSAEKLYDVMFTELCFTYNCYLPIAEKLDIPIIGTSTFRSYKFSDTVVGFSDNPAVIPLELSPHSRVEMNFVERVQNLWDHIVLDYYHKINVHREIVQFYRHEHFDEDLLNKKTISIIFVNNHPSLMPRPLPPQVVEIGGVHVKPANPLPEDIRKFVDEATHGVILFSLGSLVKMSTISPAQKNAFLAAFASLPQRVLWKFEEPIENLPKNIMISEWLPQRDILEHPNVIAFMSHCGQASVYEAVVTATPVVAIPIFGDQLSNADLLKFRGVAVVLDFKSATKETVVDVLNTIINDTTYYQRMQELSRAFKDRPMSPQELVAYWTEYVVRNNGASHLKALGSNMPRYKYLMLDILALTISIMGLALFMINAVIRKVHDALVSNRQTVRKVAAKKNQ